MERDIYLKVYYETIKRFQEQYSKLEKKISILENRLILLTEENQKIASFIEDSLQSQEKIKILLNANKEHQKYMNGYLETEK
jgi:pyruvate/2-oxoglutarate dehydrogenase complex dihydrolipoamide dehydrogenase (E3) component